ncbi:MAG: lamin tail domain-containing protein [Pirellulales bacterium]
MPYRKTDLAKIGRAAVRVLARPPAGGRRFMSRRHRMSHLEALEPRHLLAGDPIVAAEPPAVPPLLITEFMASNATSLVDVNGLTPDWIEIHNPTDALVPLAGWSLTDARKDLTKWSLPDVYLAPNDYYVVFASGRDRALEDIFLARDFNATKDGAFLVDLPEGTYDVRVTLGDSNRVRDEMAIYLQGTKVDTVTAQANAFAVRTYRAEVAAGDMGRLAIRLEDTGGETGNVAINGLRITPAGGGDPLQFDFGTADSPVGPGYVGIEKTDVYGAASYGWQADDVINSGDRGGEPDNPHTNFKLSAGGEYLALVSPAGAVVSEFGTGDDDYPPQVSDVSYGLVPGGGPREASPVGYFASPTPGAPNMASSAIIGPRIRDVTEVTGPVDDAQDLVITANIEPSQAPVDTVSLVYQVMFGDETTVPMSDDGTGSDLQAGDGIYTAVIPHTVSGPGDMVRWAVAAVDTAGYGSRVPLYAGVQFNTGQFPFTANFSEGEADGFQSVRGDWTVSDERYQGTPEAAGETLAILPALDGLGDRFTVDLTFRVSSDTSYLQNAAFVFDYYDPTDFKFVLFNSNASRWQFGQRDATGWNVLYERTKTTPVDTDMQVAIRIDGSVVTLRGRVQFSYDFGSPVNGGLVGIGSNNGQVRFGEFVFDPGGLGDLEAPKYFGTIVADSSIVTELPVLYRFIEDLPGFETRAATRGSVFFAGEFYDNVFLRVRGGTSRSWPKKSYKIEFNSGDYFRFRDDLPRVDEINVNTVFTDKAYTRATLAYELQRDSGTPSPETFPLRMQQNGEFFSVALFVEQPDEDFLARNGLDPEGALYKGGPGSRYDGGTQKFAKKTRRYEDKSDLQAFIVGLRQTDSDLEAFLFDNVDIPAQINFMATNVVTQNIDASDKNHFIYRDTQGTGEWHMMPWDIDLTFGPNALNTDTILADENTEGAVNPNTVHPLLGGRDFTLHVGKYNDFLDRMVNNPRTREMLLRRIRTMTDTYLSTSYFYDRIDQLVAQLGPDVELDKQRWGVDAHFGSTDFTLVEANDRIKREYLDRRVRYLTVVQGPDGVGIPAQQAADVQLEFGDDFELALPSDDPLRAYISVVNPNPYAVDLSGWSMAGPAHTTFAAGTVIPAGDMLYLASDVATFRSRPDGPSGGQGRFVQPVAGSLSTTGGTLSLFDTAGRLVARREYAGSGLPGPPDLRVTEINYNPHDALPSYGELAVGNDRFEFIELMNAGDSQLDLKGIRFVKTSVGGDDEGIVFTFGNERLEAGQRLVVVRDRAAFQSRYGDGLRIAGEYSGKLANGGETIRLLDAADQEILRFAYDDSAAWPARADGQGSSLEMIDVAGDRGDPRNWRSSNEFGGSPGVAGTGPVHDVVINEVAARPADNAGDWIELVNTAGTPVDIGGWYLSDDVGDLFAYQFPDDARIDPGTYRLVTESEFQFGLDGRKGDDVWLVAADKGTGKPLRFADHVELRGTESRVTFGRWPDGDAAAMPLPMESPSPAAANSGPLAGDMNHDGDVNASDADDFAWALQQPAAYQAERGVPAVFSGDLDHDGDLDFDDIAQLVALLAAEERLR